MYWAQTSNFLSLLFMLAIPVGPLFQFAERMEHNGDMGGISCCSNCYTGPFDCWREEKDTGFRRNRDK